MKLGIIGLSQSGKTTLFNTLSGQQETVGDDSVGEPQGPSAPELPVVPQGFEPSPGEGHDHHPDDADGPRAGARNDLGECAPLRCRVDQTQIENRHDERRRDHGVSRRANSGVEHAPSEREQQRDPDCHRY